MKKVLVAEIGQSTIVLNAFGDLDNGSPKLLDQVVVPSGGLGAGSSDSTKIVQTLKKALSLLEEKMGLVQGADVEVHLVTSLKEEAMNESGLGDFSFNGGILTTSEAIQKILDVLSEEVGDVLILDVGGGATGIYLMQRHQSTSIGIGLGVYRGALSIVQRIGEADIESRYGKEWRSLVQPVPKTDKEIAFGRELISHALQDTVFEFCAVEARDLVNLRWVIGTGGALANLPGGMEIIKEALTHCREISWPKDGFPVLIDQDNVLASLGALTENYRGGAWQLLLESLGVDS